MTVQDLLINLEALAMGEVFQQAIEAFYVASLQRLDNNTIERDYTSARAHFDRRMLIASCKTLKDDAE